MVSLIEIKRALDGIQKESGDDCARYIDEAIEKLKTAQEALNTVSVRGRHDVDALLGCMLGIDLIIGEDNNGR
jgi:gamma-glutamyl phosphate reductase